MTPEAQRIAPTTITMLTIHPNTRSSASQAKITPSPETSAADLERLDGLARVFSAHKSERPHLCYIFTESRGKKCWALYQAGFYASGPLCKESRYCISHAKSPKPMLISHALQCADIMGELVAVVAGEEF